MNSRITSQFRWFYKLWRFIRSCAVLAKAQQSSARTTQGLSSVGWVEGRRRLAASRRVTQHFEGFVGFHSVLPNLLLLPLLLTPTLSSLLTNLQPLVTTITEQAFDERNYVG